MTIHKRCYVCGKIDARANLRRFVKLSLYASLHFMDPELAWYHPECFTDRVMAWFEKEAPGWGYVKKEK